jgi:hypothetical protein
MGAAGFVHFYCRFNCLFSPLRHQSLTWNSYKLDCKKEFENNNRRLGSKSAKCLMKNKCFPSISTPENARSETIIYKRDLRGGKILIRFAEMPRISHKCTPKNLNYFYLYKFITAYEFFLISARIKMESSH